MPILDGKVLQNCAETIDVISCHCAPWSTPRNGKLHPRVIPALLLLSDDNGWLASLAAIFGWAFAGWGTTLYWWAGILYVVQVRRLVKADAAAD